MIDVIHVSPTRSNDTVVSWVENAVAYKLDFGFEFSDVYIFKKKKMLAVLHFAESHRDKFVGKIFDYTGQLVFEIPFPSLGIDKSNVECLYSWSTEIENGIKIVFGFDAVGYRDIWCNFDLDKQEYVDKNEAR